MLIKETDADNLEEGKTPNTPGLEMLLMSHH